MPRSPGLDGDGGRKDYRTHGGMREISALFPPSRSVSSIKVHPSPLLPQGNSSGMRSLAIQLSWKQSAYHLSDTWLIKLSFGYLFGT